MSRIDDYKVLYGYSADVLQNSVNEHISRGWQPYGSPFTVVYDEGQTVSLIQAMTFSRKDNE